MDATELSCRIQERRKKLFNNSSWNGIDFLEVEDDQKTLCVHFFGQVPENVSVENVRIEGGRRIRDIRAKNIEIDRANDPELDDCLRITLDRPGDFSIYRLCLVASRANGSQDRAPFPGLDPRYACLDFSFKVNCPSDLDCKQVQVCPPESHRVPEINYLAKDYESFLQLIYDRLALTVPEWQERHVPDLGVTLVELLAYVGDYLSYYQDAVATEAYLDTARLRVSVRRHVRLIDYRMHEGCNARAWVSIWTDSDQTLRAGSFYFITGFPELPSGSGWVLAEADLEQFETSRFEVFEPVLPESEQEIWIYAVQSEMHFYTWGDTECCLPLGATRATLVDKGDVSVPGEAGGNGAQNGLWLKPGDVLIFEEVLGPTTGDPADADPSHRHAVRLTHVESKVDGLLEGQRVVEIEWAPDDALPFSLCISVRLPAPDCRRVNHVSVARGNVILVDHGRSVQEPLGPVGSGEEVGECGCEGTAIETTVTALRFRPTLRNAPLTFREPVRWDGPVSGALEQDVRKALPQLVLDESVPQNAQSSPEWHAQYDLLESGNDDRHFVAEIDEDGHGHLRFGDGELGRQPDAGTTFSARYRVGNGPIGNVGRDTIDHLVLREGRLSGSGIRPRNPLPATGGTAGESIADVKLNAPGAVRKRLERAITADDYAKLAGAFPKLQGAAADLAWTGSWYEARVAIDPLHTEEVDPALLQEVDALLEKYRRMGHDVAVAPALYVPIDLSMEVCVLPHHSRAHVKPALLDVFSSRQLPDGRLGFFHPDNLTFGDDIFVSKIVATAMAVEGVETVRVKRLQRLNAPPNDEIKKGVLALASEEIAQLDNDPNFPENGKLELIVRGGR